MVIWIEVLKSLCKMTIIVCLLFHPKGSSHTCAWSKVKEESQQWDPLSFSSRWPMFLLLLVPNPLLSLPYSFIRSLAHSLLPPLPLSFYSLVSPLLFSFHSVLLFTFLHSSFLNLPCISSPQGLSFAAYHFHQDLIKSCVNSRSGLFLLLYCSNHI